MSVQIVKLKFPQHVHECSACETKFIVAYVDESGELYPQVVEICPYCGGYTKSKEDDLLLEKIFGEEDERN